jgi:hypothetical protein
MLEENSLTGKHAPELARVAKGVMDVKEKIGEVYSESSEKVEEVWNRCECSLFSLEYFGHILMIQQLVLAFKTSWLRPER